MSTLKEQFTKWVNLRLLDETTEYAKGVNAGMKEVVNLFDAESKNPRISELEDQLSSLRAENERLTIMATDAELLRTKLDYKTEENKRNILAINDLHKRCKDLEAGLNTTLKELIYQSTTGHWWYWARSNEAVPERILEIQKLLSQ